MLRRQYLIVSKKADSNNLNLINRSQNFKIKGL